MPTTKMGFEGRIYVGGTGSTAATLLENVKDIAYNLDIEKGDTTVRGDSTTVPIKTEDPTLRTVSIEWTMINDTTDANYEALRVAAAAGSAKAIRTKDHATGKGFDGDCSLSMQNGMPLAGEQTTQFTATPSRGYGRPPQLYV